MYYYVHMDGVPRQYKLQSIVSRDSWNTKSVSHLGTNPFQIIRMSTEPRILFSEPIPSYVHLIHLAYFVLAVVLLPKSTHLPYYYYSHSDHSR